MKRLYLRIYLAVIASIILSVVLAGAAWRVFGEHESFFDRQEFFVAAAEAMLPPAPPGTATQQPAQSRITKPAAPSRPAYLEVIAT